MTVIDEDGHEGTANLEVEVIGIADMDVGSRHSCAVDDEGLAWCWGFNGQGRLGTGEDGEDLEVSAFPRRVAPDDGFAFAAIWAGNAHSCAIDEDRDARSAYAPPVLDPVARAALAHIV